MPDPHDAVGYLIARDPRGEAIKQAVAKALGKG